MDPHPKAFFVVVLALMVISSHVDASKWIAKSSNSTTPSWRRHLDLTKTTTSHFGDESHGNMDRTLMTRRSLDEDTLELLELGTVLSLYVPLVYPFEYLERVY